MPSNDRSALLPYLSACVLALLALGGFWYAWGKPVILADAVTSTHKLQCASYTPFDKNQSPFDQPLVVDPQRVDADLALLAQSFQCVRTYSMYGLDSLPAMARKHGLKLMIGAWVSGNAQATAGEISALIASANANPDVVQAVIVGNETLLRGEITPQQLVQLIRQVKSQVKQPVTYADVWGFWSHDEPIAAEVDFITVHILPYWDNHTHGIDDAVARVGAMREKLGKRFAPKDVLIGETGWPSEGRQRDTAVPSRVNQARFFRAFVALADAKGWHYNLIEAFDQPWKRGIEGSVGGYWGLFDADRHDKDALAGPVSNLPDWPAWLGASAALGLLTLGLAGRPRSGRSAWLLPALAALGACGELAWAHQTWLDARYTDEWLWMGALGLLNLLVLAHAALHLSASHGWRRRVFAALDRRAHWWLLGTGFAAAVIALQMTFDPLYRSFSSSILLMPALVYLLRPTPGPRREILLLGTIVALSLLPQLYLEGLRNLQAWQWLGVSLLLAAALARCWRVSVR